MPVLREPQTPSGHHVIGLPGADEAPGVYARGRRCDEPGCITLLTIYNGGPWCFVHATKHEHRLLAEEAEAEARRALPRTRHRASHARGSVEMAA